MFKKMFHKLFDNQLHYNIPILEFFKCLTKLNKINNILFILTIIQQLKANKCIQISFYNRLLIKFISFLYF
jgi:hypothetical protein